MGPRARTPGPRREPRPGRHPDGLTEERNMDEPVPDDLLEIADALLPGAPLGTARLFGGGMHDVVLLPGVAAVRVTKRPSGAAALPRRTELLRVIAEAGL